MYKLEDYIKEINRCLQCNFCLATCPVYKEDMVESSMARGRLNLINAAMVEKSIPLSDRVRELVNRCLLCTSCMQGCPSGIPVDDIIIAARQQLFNKFGSGLVEKFVFRQVLNQRSAGTLATRAVSLLRKFNLFPGSVPPLASPPFEQRISGTVRPSGVARARVAYFIGCGTNFLYPDTGEAVVKVLVENGVEVVIPPNQNCCGIPALAHGDQQAALEAIRGNAEIFASLDVDAVITDCTSCGYMLKVKAAKVLPPDDPCRSQVVALAGKVLEVTDYLTGLGLEKTPRLQSSRVTYHVPCHRAWSQGLSDAPRKLLALIPGIRLVEMQNPLGCCGAGGTTFITHSGLSERIRLRKLEDMLGTGAEIVVTQCPACRYYLNEGLKEKGGIR
ncbi:MAG: (Fe-S)-binding protein, partial [Desulfofundulus sp.]